MGTVSWAVLSAGWVSQGGGGAVVVAMAAAVEAALLAQARVSRTVAALLIPLLSLAAIVPTTLSSMPFDGNGALGHTVSRYLAAIAGGLTSSTDWTFIVGLCAMLWICGYWLGWLAMREHRGVLAVIPLYAVLATNVLNSKSPDSTALPEALSVLLTLVVIAGAHLDSLQARWSQHRIPTLRGTRGRFAVTVAGAAVVLTAAAVLIPPISTVDISGRFFPGSGSGANNLGGAGGAGTIQFSAGTVPGGSLVSQPQPVLTYSVDTSTPVYLSVVDDTEFIAGNWYPNQGTAPTNPGSGVSYAGLQFSPGPLPRDLSSADGVGTASTVTVHATITVQPQATGNTSYALFTGEPGSVDRRGIAFGAIDNSRPQSLLTVESVQLSTGITQQTVLHTTARLSTATVDQLRDAGTAYPAFTRQYTALPDDNTREAVTITQLARQWTTGTTNPYDAAVAIETHLRDPNFFRYTLTPPAAPDGLWPVVYFLTQSHEGYCQYFASAMGAMLRSLGIPTRLVNGYGPGTTLTGGHQGQRQQLVTTSDAHTWVEAFFPGYGWIPFEPTPASSEGAYGPFARGAAAVAPPASTPNSGPSATPGNVRPGFNDAASAGAAGGAAASRGASPWVVLGLAAAALLVLLLASVAWLLLPRSTRGAWRRVEILGALRGTRRRSGETHREYAERMAPASPRFSPAMRELAALLGRAEFSAAAADSRMRRRATSLARRIVTGTPRTIWRARRRPEPI